MNLRLVIADHRILVRLGWKSVCDQLTGEVAAEVTQCGDLFAAVANSKPSLAVVHARLPGGDAIEVVERIRGEMPAIPLIMTGERGAHSTIARATAIGVSEFLFDTDSLEDLVAGITRAAEGQLAPANSPLNLIRNQMTRKRRDSELQVPLTERELQVLRHIAHGLSNREIGNSLQISVETVKEHVQNILRKIDVKDRTQAAVWAVRQGVV